MSWIVARTEPSREQTARRFLELAKFTVYIPLIRERPTKGGRRIERLRPLFPSYAFIAFRDGRWWDVRWSVAVAAVIMAGNGPLQLGRSHHRRASGPRTWRRRRFAQARGVPGW
jgi:hypothetical protein